MKVLFDHQIFYNKFGGVPKYFSKLLKYLPNDCWQCTALYPYAEYLREDGLMKVHKKHFRGDSVIMEILNRPYTYWELSRGKYDVYHQTNFSVENLTYAKETPIVTTYHDSNLSTIDSHPDIVKRQKISLERADAIVCVSENTKRDMLNLFDIEESKVNVIYHGVEDVDLSVLPQNRIIENPYILFVGRRSAYKNFNVMALAFAEVHKLYKEVKLVCTSKPFSEEEKKYFQRLGIDKDVIQISASEQIMLQLYRDAEVFVFPSLYEGFGIPILEAWQCNCPVILSSTSCFPEIAEDAAIYFNAVDYTELANKITDVLTDIAIRQKYQIRGAKRVQNFSWEKCAKQHFDLYKSLI